MSEKRARYIGDPDGAEITVPVGDEGEFRNLHIPHGGEVPTEIDGLRVPASYRDSLLEQTTNWTEVKRATGDETKGKNDDDKKGGDA